MSEGRPSIAAMAMDWKIELIHIPVSDVDRAKRFYAEQLGFTVDTDERPNANLRYVQCTPPGSACSIAFGEGVTKMAPGSQGGIQIVVPDAAAARQHLLDNGVAASEINDQPWGRFVLFDDPDGNGWILQEFPPES